MKFVCLKMRQISPNATLCFQEVSRFKDFVKCDTGTEFANRIYGYFFNNFVQGGRLVYYEDLPEEIAYHICFLTMKAA